MSMICFPMRHDREVMICVDQVISAVKDDGYVDITMKDGQHFTVMVDWDEFLNLLKAKRV